MATVTKRELIERIAAATGLSRTQVKEAVQQFLDEMIIELGKGNRLEFRDFGVFEVKTRAARRAQNPKTLERVDVPAKQTVKFKPGRRMRELLDSEAPADQTTAKPTTKPSAKPATKQVAKPDIKPDIKPGIKSDKPRSAGFVENKPERTEPAATDTD